MEEWGRRRALLALQARGGRHGREVHVGSTSVGGGQEHYVMEEAELGKVSHSSGQEVPALPSASSSQPTFPFTFRLVSLYFVPIAL